MASGQIRMTPDTMRGRAGEYRAEAVESTDTQIANQFSM